MDKKVLTVIPARGGSKGIPRKNIIDFGGKPLIAWTIETAKNAEFVSRVLVSTDDPEIQQVAIDHGADSPFLRPEELSGDNVHSIHAITHTLNWLKENENYQPDAVFMLLPTSPFRISEDLDGSIKLFFESGGNMPVVGVRTLKPRDINLRYLDPSNKLTPLVKLTKGQQHKDAQQLAYVTGEIFLAQPQQLIRDENFHIPGQLGYLITGPEQVEIDFPEDLEKARQYLQKLQNEGHL